MQKITGFFLIASLSFLALGCRGSGMATVEGTITMDDKPLVGASVLFVPANGRPSGARTDANGKYVLTYTDTKKGALPGKYKIRISTKADAYTDADDKPVPAMKETIPAEYNDQTKLEFEVLEGKKNIADFPLKSGGKITKSDGY